GNQSAKTSRAEVTQPAIGGAPMPTVVYRVDKESGRIQRPCKPVIAFAMLGESMGNLHHPSGFAGTLCPGVGRDPGAVRVGEKGGGRSAHRLILTRSCFRLI